MTSFEEQFEKACNARDLPGVVLVASDVKGKRLHPIRRLQGCLQLSGNFKYEKAFGYKNAEEKINVDATFIMASCTKLMTSISTLQCVERGQFGLDDDVSTVLTELKDIQILTGYKEGTEDAIYKKAENKITIRYVASAPKFVQID